MAAQPPVWPVPLEPATHFANGVLQNKAPSPSQPIDQRQGGGLKEAPPPTSPVSGTPVVDLTFQDLQFRKQVVLSEHVWVVAFINPNCKCATAAATSRMFAEGVYRMP
jgi:hypothetical protein